MAKRKPKKKTQARRATKTKAKARTSKKRSARAKAKARTPKKRGARAKAKPRTSKKRSARAKAKARTSKKRSARAKAKARTSKKRSARAKAKARTSKKRSARAKAKPKGTKKKTAKKRAPALKARPTVKRGATKKTAPSKAVSRQAAKTPRPSHKARGIKAKVLPRDFLVGLGIAIRKAVAPTIRNAKGREIVGTATSGDPTFKIDKVAEKALLAFLKESRLPIAYYSEDAGYTTFTTGQPQNLLIVDPIDGTRAAKSGFEACVVSVGSTRVIERPRIGDVDNACVVEILGERTFYAERGRGARVYMDGHVKKPKPSNTTDLEMVSWSMTVPARPAELIFPTAAKLIDLTSLKGGFFACNSTSYSLTRLLTNQLDACVDFANRYLRDIPKAVEDQFINAGRGIILGIAPYDIAASLLIAQEAGCIVTDAYGQDFDDVLLLDSSVSNHRSMVAASNKGLHDKLMSFFDTRINQFEQLLMRRAEMA